MLGVNVLACFLAFFLLFIGDSFAFLIPNLGKNSLLKNKMRVYSGASEHTSIFEMSNEEYFASLPEDIRKMKGPFEMCYVERVTPPEQTAKGLYVPLKDDEATLQTVRIIMIGDGEVGESGTQVPIDGLKGKEGFFAHTKQPFGIGPRDDIIGERKFSFVRNRDILAVVE